MRFDWTCSQYAADAATSAPATSVCAFLTVLDAVLATVSFLIINVLLSLGRLVRILVFPLVLICQLNKASVRQPATV